MPQENKRPNWASKLALATGIALSGAEARAQAPVAEAPRIVEKAESIDPTVQYHIKLIRDRLGEISEARKKTKPKEIERLIAELGNNDFRAREDAGKALAKIGYPAKRQLRMAAASSSDAEIRQRAERLLKPLARVEKTLEVFLVPSVRILGQYGEAAAPAMPELLAAFEEGNTELKINAARTFSKIGRGAKDAVPVLAEYAAYPYSPVRKHAIEALGNIGGAARKSLPVMIEAMKEKDFDIRYNAIEAVGKLAPQAKDASAQNALQALIGALGDEYPGGRSVAAGAIGHFGREGKAAVPALIAALKTEQDLNAQADVAWALGNVGVADKEKVIKELKAWMESKKERGEDVWTNNMNSAHQNLGSRIIENLQSYSRER